MDYQEIITAFYPDDNELRRLLVHHSGQVRAKALAVCRRHPDLPVDHALVEAGAMLHDIGICRCDAPGIHCHGTAHYLLHGLEGGAMLRGLAAAATTGAADAARLEALARICERHTGTGLKPEAFGRRGLPVPACLAADAGCLSPETLEEQIVCYADKFFSKSHPERTRTVGQTLESLRKFGDDGMEIFSRWAERFE